MIGNDAELKVMRERVSAREQLLQTLRAARPGGVGRAQLGLPTRDRTHTGRDPGLLVQGAPR